MDYCIALIILTGIMVWVSKKSSMLRNEIFSDENFCKLAKGIKNPRPAFSLGRTQLAFWTVIIVSSFLRAVLCEDSLCDFKVPEISNVNLALLGIAAGTTLVSKVIDTSQKENQGAAISQQDYPSKGFLTDIISDEKGVSIHRLQNVVWTLVVGFIYITYVACHCNQMPDEHIITPQLLALMGVSTSAYLGLKLNENKNTPAPEEKYKNIDPDAGGGVGNGVAPPPPPVPQPEIEALSDSPATNEAITGNEIPPAPQLPPEENNS